MLVDRGLLRDEGINVGDADHDFHVAIGDAFGDLDLIEVARGVVVDGRPEQIAQIADVSVGRDLRRMGLQFGELLRNLGRKFWFEAVMLHDFFGGGLQVEMRRIGVWHELPVRT